MALSMRRAETVPVGACSSTAGRASVAPVVVVIVRPVSSTGVSGWPELEPSGRSGRNSVDPGTARRGNVPMWRQLPLASRASTDMPARGSCRVRRQPPAPAWSWSWVG